MSRGSNRALWFVFLLPLASCGTSKTPSVEKPAAITAAAMPEGFKPAASILDLMLYPIDPVADQLWEAVATISTVEGVEDVHPQTDEEWLVLRAKAIEMMEAANLLVIEGRRVGHPGQKVEGPGQSTDLTPEQAQVEIDKDRASFVAFSKLLQDSAGRLVTAIDARDVDAYLEAGGALDEACEACHRRFWFPNSPMPPGI